MSNFNKVINKYKDCKMKDWNWFFYFLGWCWGMQQSNNEKLLKNPFLHMLNILQLLSEMESMYWWWLLIAKFMPPDMLDLWNMSHVIDSPMITISNSCLHPSSITYNMGMMFSLINNFVNWLSSTSILVFLHIPLFLLFITARSHF